MAIETRVDEEAGIRIHEVRGRMGKREFLDGVAHVFTAPDFDRSLAALWDLRDADIDMSAEDVRELVERVAELPHGLGPVALVVAGDYPFGMARMYETLFSARSTTPAMVFRDVDAARDWLIGGREDPTDQRRPEPTEPT